VDLRVEIAGDQVVCRQDGVKAFVVPLHQVVAALCARGDAPSLPEAIPDGVKFARYCGDVTVLVLEERPAVRSVKWLTGDSPAPFGRRAVYRTVRLAFPFVVMVVAFRSGGLTGYQQCFYRTAPLVHSAQFEHLMLPNLPNVSPDAYGMRSWLCLAQLKTDLKALSWCDKVGEIRRHFWGAGFNRSSELFEGASHWTATRGIDRRIETLDSWERASRDDPFFPLRVVWRSAGITVGEVVDAMVAALAPPPVATAIQFAQLLSLLHARVPSRARSAG
jgi:hypothetical protein